MVNNRKAIEKTYTGKCSIYEYESVRDETTKITNTQEVLKVENVPCRLSFERITAVVQTETAPTQSQSIKLFLAPEVEVKTGSKIVVEQNGFMGEYSVSGEPATYQSHKEIMLELFRGWA